MKRYQSLLDKGGGERATPVKGSAYPSPQGSLNVVIFFLGLSRPLTPPYGRGYWNSFSSGHSSSVQTHPLASWTKLISNCVFRQSSSSLHPKSQRKNSRYYAGIDIFSFNIGILLARISKQQRYSSSSCNSMDHYRVRLTSARKRRSFSWRSHFHCPQASIRLRE